MPIKPSFDYPVTITHYRSTGHEIKVHISSHPRKLTTSYLRGISHLYIYSMWKMLKSMYLWKVQILSTFFFWKYIICTERWQRTNLYAQWNNWSGYLFWPPATRLWWGLPCYFLVYQQQRSSDLFSIAHIFNFFGLTFILDLNECSTNGCEANTDFCVNTFGSFYCISLIPFSK